MAWIGSTVAVILALIPGISDLIIGRTPSYNPELAIFTATLVAVVWYVYWTYRVVLVPTVENEMQRQVHRGSLATALIAELQWLDRILRDIYEQGHWAYDPIFYPLLERAEQNLHIFSSDTISKIANFHFRLLIVK